MDGGRRLTQSLRLLSDLKNAARGVAILTHEWWQRRRRERLARQLERPQQHRVIVWLEKYLPARLGVTATVLILIGSVSFGVVRGGHLDEALAGFNDARNALANLAGFRITSVSITGRKQLTHDEVLAMGGVTGRSSLLFLDAAAVRDRLKANPWIADATVLKFFPGELQIDITERTAFARLQVDGHMSVIADDGAVLEPYVARRFMSLPLVVGKGAGPLAKDFLALLARYPQVASQTRAVALVGERRWNVWLGNGLVIRLPEHEVGNALALPFADGAFDAAAFATTSDSLRRQIYPSWRLSVLCRDPDQADAARAAIEALLVETGASVREVRRGVFVLEKSSGAESPRPMAAPEDARPSEVEAVTVTAAYAALANGGKLMRPYVVSEVRKAGGAVVDLGGRPPLYNQREPIHGELVALPLALREAVLAGLR